MSKSKRQSIKSLGSAILLAGSSRSVFSQSSASYPSKPIRLVVPSAAGGSPDLICRLLATELAALLGQPVVVDNKPGAGGAIGMNDIYRAAPDGYTLGYGNVVTLSINRSLYTKLSYDPDGLTGIAQLGTVQNALVVRNDLPVRSVKELIAYAKSRPGKLTMGSAGNGTTGHLGGEMFKSLTGTFITHVPYRGSAQAIQDLIGGQIDLMFDNLSSISSHIKGGRVRALAVSGAKRSALFPQLPTVQEEGVKGYETTAWGGIVGPKGLPADVVSRLNTEINKAISSATLREKYAQLAFESNVSTPTKILEMATLEAPLWADVIKRSGAKVGLRMNASFVIRGAVVIDGTGQERYAADVEVENGVIHAILPVGGQSKFESFDANGLILAPGFIDAHTHDDVLVIEGQSPHPKLSQGVCTVVTGNCGISVAPLQSDNPPPPLDLLGSQAFKYASFAKYLASIDQAEPAMNVVPLVGHTTARVKHVCRSFSACK